MARTDSPHVGARASSANDATWPSPASIHAPTGVVWTVHMPPQFFAWIVPDQIAACANPAFVESLGLALGAERIGLVVNLDEPADPPELLALRAARGVHLPVADFMAPSEEQLEQGV